MQKLFQGKTWLLGDHVSTDELMPSASMYGKVPQEEMKYYCLKNLKPEFAKNVNPGDLLIAGKNFGCGSSRPASRNLQNLGIQCVVAESVSALFFRNSISMGFPIIICEGITQHFNDGDEGCVEPTSGVIKNLTTSFEARGEKLPSFLMNIISRGGLLYFVRNQQKIQNLF